MSTTDDRKIAPLKNPNGEKTARALASIAAVERKRVASGYALMAGFAVFEVTVQGDSWFGRATRASKWLCIWFAMVAPVYLFWSVVF